MDDTPNDTAAPPEASELDAARAKLAAAEKELANYKLRLADFENARKRLLRDAEVERKYAAEPFAADLLAVLDNLDRALAAARQAGDDGPLAAGTTHPFVLDARGLPGGVYFVRAEGVAAAANRRAVPFRNRS